MGIFGFVVAGGGSIGVLLGDLLTDVLDWHWIFLVNLPVGIAVVALSLVVLPAARGAASSGRLDVAGAVTVTLASMLAVYGIVNGNETGWASTQAIATLAAAAAAVRGRAGALRPGPGRRELRRRRPARHALTGGYQAAFLAGAVFAIAAAVIGAALLGDRPAPAPEQNADAAFDELADEEPQPVSY